VVSLARSYGVTARAVRDIWRGRTWSGVTSESSFRLMKIAAPSGLNKTVHHSKKTGTGRMNIIEKVCLVIAQ
jgi:hypothetical protein